MAVADVTREPAEYLLESLATPRALVIIGR